jgi:hypothetical protein
VCYSVLGIERLGREIERLQRVLIVRRDEDRGRHLIRADRPCDLEARLSGHLNVEKDDVRAQSPECFDRRDPVVRRADDLDSLFVRQQVLDALPGQRLVVDDQDSNGGRCHQCTASVW